MNKVKELLERKDQKIRALEERASRKEEEVEELEEKQEKIVECIHAEKIMLKKKLDTALETIEIMSKQDQPTSSLSADPGNT